MTSVPASTAPGKRADCRPAIFAAGTASALLYAGVALVLPIGNSWWHVGQFLGAFAALSVLCFWTWRQVARGERNGRMRLVLGFALLFRLLMLPAGWTGPDPLTALGRDLGGEQPGYGKFLLYDNDVWRYVWDGHVVATGRSPYAHSPAAIEADDDLAAEILDRDLWWDVWDNVSFRSLVTVYPPAAQWTFGVAATVAPGSVLVLKLGIVIADFAVCLLLLAILGRLGLPRAGLVLYAWNPLVLKEFAGSAHFEPLVVLAMLACVDWVVCRRPMLAATAVSVVALLKVAPLALAAVLARRLRWRHALVSLAVLAAGLAPYWRSLGGWVETMTVYGRDWQFNSGVWGVLRWAFDAVGLESAPALATVLCRLAVVAVLVDVWRRDDGSPRAAYRGAFVALAVLVLLSPAVMPWYLTWALPFAIVAGFPAWAVLCMLSLLSYGFYAGEVELVWWRLVEYGGALLAWVLLPRGPGVEGPRRDPSGDSEGAFATPNG